MDRIAIAVEFSDVRLCQIRETTRVRPGQLDIKRAAEKTQSVNVARHLIHVQCLVVKLLRRQSYEKIAYCTQCCITVHYCMSIEHTNCIVYRAVKKINISKKWNLQQLEARDELALELRLRGQPRHLLAERVAEKIYVLLCAAHRFHALERRHQLCVIVARLRRAGRTRVRSLTSEQIALKISRFYGLGER